MSNFTDTKTSQISELHKIYNEYFDSDKDGFFVEVGAYDGYRWSNTTSLIESDWSGILVEPIDEYFKSCQDRYKDNRKIQIYNCCIGWENQPSKKVYFGGPCTTIMEEMIPIYNETDPSDNHSLDNYEIRDMFTLDKFLEDKKVKQNFEVLCIDVEGAEWKILEVLLRGPNQQIRKKTQTKTKKKTIVKTMYPFQSKNTTNAKLTTS